MSKFLLSLVAFALLFPGSIMFWGAMIVGYPAQTFVALLMLCLLVLVAIALKNKKDNEK